MYQGEHIQWVCLSYFGFYLKWCSDGVVKIKSTFLLGKIDRSVDFFLAFFQKQPEHHKNFTSVNIIKGMTKFGKVCTQKSYFSVAPAHFAGYDHRHLHAK